MRQIAMKCSQCGAALPPRSRWSVIDCSYCHARTVLDGSSIVERREYRDAFEAVGSARRSRANARVGGWDYELAVEPLRGESSDVYAGRRCAPLAEAVVVKVLRPGQDEGRLTREAETLELLQASAAAGSDHYSRLVPQPVASGRLEGGPGDGRPALVLRRLSGFVETLADAAPQTRRDPRHSVWIWKRLLELLDWTHRCGLVHAAVTPRHAVIHARDHGVLLVGWSAAVKPGARLREVWSADEAFYPSEVLGGGPFDARADLVMAARCAAFSLTGEPGDAGRELPEPLRALLQSWALGEAAQTDAWSLREAVDAASRAAFGPPKYAELRTAAWG